MKIVVNTKELDAALAKAGAVVKAKSTLDILSHVRLEVPEWGQSLTLSATNLDVHFSTTIDAEVDAPGAVTLPARALSGTVKKLAGREERLRLEAEDQHWVQLSARRFKQRLAGAHPDDFPRMADVSSAELTEVGATDFIRALERVAFSIGTDDGRANLTGAFIRSHGERTVFVSTDGHRLSRFYSDVRLPFDEGIILPRTGIDAIRKAFGDVDFVRVGLGGPNGNSLVVRAGHTMVCTQLVDGAFPDFENALGGRGRGVRATLPVRELVDAIGLVSVTISIGRQVRLTFGAGEIEVYASNSEGKGKNQGETNQILQAETRGGVKAAYNHQYLLEALGALETEDCDLEIVDSFAPTLIREPGSDDVLYVVMPMRL